MSSLSQQILQTIETFAPEEQQQVLDFVELLEIKRQKTTTTEPETVPQSFFEVARSSIGAGEGPGDLSTNPDYMRGYGGNAPESNC